MSSKKEIRRKRREREQDNGRSGRNPAVMFALGIAGAILITLGAFALWGDPGGPGDPPRPGAVWSAAHNHWH